MSARTQREPSCVAAWPECHSGGYDPRCCRFPKSCSVETVFIPKPGDVPVGGFVAGDVVRNPIEWLGTVLEERGGGSFLVEFAELSGPVQMWPHELRLAGTRCIPFEAMTMPQRRDHLRFAHGYNDFWLRDRGLIAAAYETTHDFAHRHNNPPIRIPHTHRKETRP